MSERIKDDAFEMRPFSSQPYFQMAGTPMGFAENAKKSG